MQNGVILFMYLSQSINFPSTTNIDGSQSLSVSNRDKLGENIEIALLTTATGSIRRITALGNNPNISISSTPEDIWPVGGIYKFLSSGSPMEIFSDNSVDNLAGSGGRNVLINGLDENYSEIAQTINLSGTTPVSIPTNLMRINSALLMSAGSGEVNMGNIIIRDVANTITGAYIPAGAGITRQAIYTVPSGYTLVINSQIFGINRSTTTKDTIEIVTHIRSNNGFYREPLILAVDSRNAPYRHDGEPGITITQKNDFTLRCTYTDGPVNVTAGFLGVLVKNDVITRI